MANIDFENIEEKFEKTLTTKEWKKFVKEFNECDDIYIVANGGLWAVGNHAADDCTRLFAKAGIKKHISTMESQCLIRTCIVFIVLSCFLDRVSGKSSPNNSLTTTIGRLYSYVIILCCETPHSHSRL